MITVTQLVNVHVGNRPISLKWKDEIKLYETT